MAFLGRDSQADLQRIERVKAWTEARSAYALVSVGAGLLSIVDCVMLVIGVPAGVAAIALGILGLREIRRQPQLLGRRLAIAGICLGVAGLALSVLMWAWVLPWLRDR